MNRKIKTELDKKPQKEKMAVASRAARGLNDIFFPLYSAMVHPPTRFKGAI
jgi:hypothetical protein